MLEVDAEFRERLIKRLREEEIIWFTSVNPRGVPASNPVWFYWDGEYILVYSQPESHRVRNLEQNPHVCLHLQDVDGEGNNVAIINGDAVMKRNNQGAPQGYWDKYDKYLPGLGSTREQLVASYSVEIRIRPTRVRGE